MNTYFTLSFFDSGFNYIKLYSDIKQANMTQYSKRQL